MKTAATLVIHPGALGDVLQAVPALRALRRAGPVTLAAQPRLGRLLRGLGVVDNAWPFDAMGLEALFTEDAASERLDGLADFARVVSWFGARDATYCRRLPALARDAVIASPVPLDAVATWRHLLDTVSADSTPELAP